jgi:hypothetical protein
MALHQEKLIGLTFARRGLRQLNPLRGAAAALLMTLLAPGAVRAAAKEISSTGDLYVQAATEEQVPLDVLVAIAGAESGYHPWALNIDGHEVYCRSREEAEQRLATGDHVSIGLMQINWRYWGSRLGRTKAELLDPETNLIYGARILKEGLRRGGSIWFRISNYHSGSLQERDKYNQLVYRNYRRYLEGEPTAERPAARGTSRDMAQTGTPPVSEGSLLRTLGSEIPVGNQPARGSVTRNPSTAFRWFRGKRKPLGKLFAFGDDVAAPAWRDP